MTAQSLEASEKAVEALLQAEIGAALDAVEAYWTAQSDPLALGDPVTWLRGHQPTVIERERADFPIITTWAFKQTGLTRSDQWGYGTAEHTIYLNWFVDGDTEDEANVMGQRYAEAILAVLQAHQKPTAALTNRSYLPDIELSTVERSLPPDAGSDLSGDTWYSQMGQMTLTFEAVY